VSSLEFSLVTGLTEAGATDAAAYRIQLEAARTPPQQGVQAPARKTRPTSAAVTHPAPTPSRRCVRSGRRAGIVVGLIVGVGLMAALCLDMPVNTPRTEVPLVANTPASASIELPLASPAEHASEHKPTPARATGARKAAAAASGRVGGATRLRGTAPEESEEQP